MNTATCGGGFCRHDPNCSRRNCEGHPRQTEEDDEREARLSAAMNQPITHDGGMQVSFDSDEPLCEPLAIELFAVLAAVAFAAVFGLALLWAIYQLWPILVASVGI